MATTSLPSATELADVCSRLGAGEKAQLQENARNPHLPRLLSARRTGA